MTKTALAELNVTSIHHGPLLHKKKKKEIQKLYASALLWQTGNLSRVDVQD